jgi:predicted kinase
MDVSRFTNLDVVLICGLPGAGKSVLAGKYFGGTGRKRVNRKEIRRFLFEMINFGKQWSEADFRASDEVLVRHTERKIIEHLLQNKSRVLIDDTSVSGESRSIYTSIAKQMRKSIGAIFINTPTIKCIERNRERTNPIPEIVISKLSASLVVPAKEEGFEEVLVIQG